MTKKKDVTVKPDVIDVTASAKDNILNEKLEPGEVQYLKPGDQIEEPLPFKVILSPFISDRMQQLTCQLPDETPLRLDVSAPHGYTMVIKLGDWRRLYKFYKNL